MRRLCYVRPHPGRNEKISVSRGIALTLNSTWPIGSRCTKNDRLTYNLVKSSWWTMPNGEICPLYSVFWARWTVKNCVFFFVILGPSILLSYITVHFCSTDNIQILLIFNGQTTRYLTKSKYCRSFAHAVFESLLMLSVIHFLVLIIAVYTKTMLKWQYPNPFLLFNDQNEGFGATYTTSPLPTEL